jgi:hypothetical protein
VGNAFLSTILHRGVIVRGQKNCEAYSSFGALTKLGGLLARNRLADFRKLH